MFIIMIKIIMGIILFAGVKVMADAIEDTFKSYDNVETDYSNVKY